MKNINDTTIEYGSTIKGSLQMSGSLNVLGAIYGDVNNSGICQMEGTIIGNLSCFNLEMNEASYVKGDVFTSYNVVLNSGIIDGNIQAQNAQINGVVNGDIITSGELTLLSGAIVNGDITTSTLQVEPNAKIKGFIQIKYQLRR